MEFDNLSKKIIVILYNYKKNKILTNKISKIASNLNINKRIFNKKKLESHIKKWKELYPNVSAKWYKVYSTVLGHEDENFVPENIYYLVIEPTLNNKQVYKAYSDKNFYNLYYDEKLFPNTIIRNIDGVYYDSNYKFISLSNQNLINILSRYKKIIVKPAIDSGGGKAVDLFINTGHFFKNKNKKILSLNYLEKIYKRNFLIQEYISQHAFFKQFNKDSVNTIRIFTYRSVKNNNIIILHSLLRIGRKGNFVDNQASGGISCGIKETGELNSFAIDKYGNKYFEINGINLSNKLKIPYFEEVKIIARQIAEKNIYARLLGLDFYVNNENKIKLIEINNINNEINFYQMNNGSLFGDYTNEIIEFCSKNYKSFVIDYYY
ncbi:sugar-transfer associated ATP-grasp domain-containing protein [Calditrichota bacterium LG25]